MYSTQHQHPLHRLFSPLPHTMASFTRRAALAALFLLLCAGGARAMESPCDDGMDEDIGTELKKAQSPAAASVRWAVPLTSAAVRATNLNQVFRKRSCKLVSYTVKKLRVPKVGHGRVVVSFPPVPSCRRPAAARMQVHAPPHPAHLHPVPTSSCPPAEQQSRKLPCEGEHQLQLWLHVCQVSHCHAG